MVPRDRILFERLLLEERRRLEGLLASTRDELGDGPASADQWLAGDFTDVATEATAREAGATQAVRESEEFSEVDEALQLLYTHPEKYGICITCGHPIDHTRLEVLPATRYCAKDAARAVRAAPASPVSFWPAAIQPSSDR